MEKSALLETHHDGSLMNGECRRLLLTLTLLAWLFLFGSFCGVFSFHYGVCWSFRGVFHSLTILTREFLTPT